MAISYQVDGMKQPSIRKRDFLRWVQTIAHILGKEIGNINYVFCTDERMLEINNQYLQHNYYTDIITFDYSDGNTIAGDLIISLDTVKSNSEKYHTNYIHELHRVAIHGILHLCGINDKTNKEEKQMREYEDRALNLLSDANEYPNGLPIKQHTPSYCIKK